MNSHSATNVSPVQDALEALHAKFATLHEGNVAAYIPELASADPDWFGIALATADGFVYEAGDSRQAFTIQSISKPFVYGLALEDQGRADVMKKVGVEPSGDAFNAISLHQETGRPFNPMINAGAIATTGMVGGKSARTRLERIMRTFELYAGRELEIDEAVYRSECETGHRNRAIGHMLRNFNILTEEPDPVVDLYFKQCSISVTCRDLALMAATLANHGLNPMTEKQAIRGEYVESVLSVMGSCGMYDFAGEWIYKIGMPAKSGVSGGVIAVLPGQLGIGVFSPRLDAHGNSIRGIRVCEELSRYFDLHLFNPPNANDSVIWLKFTGAEISSSRQRTAAEIAILHEFGMGTHVYQLQGKLVFSTAEVVVRDLVENAAKIDAAIIDLKRVLCINESACRLLHGLVKQMAQLGKPVLFTHGAQTALLRRYMKAKLGDGFADGFRLFEENDLALEWCENRILQQKLPPASLNGAISPREHELFSGLSSDELDVIERLLERRSYDSGEVIIRFGDEADAVFFLARGTLSVTLTLANGSQRRLATLSPGMTFGEMAVIDGARRSAVVVADSAVECDILKVEEFNRLMNSHPRIKIALLKNLNLALCRKLRKANRELSVFER